MSLLIISCQEIKSRNYFPLCSSNGKNDFIPFNEFGSLDSLTSVTTFSYIASRDQREREEDIYEVKPSTIVLRKKKNVPRITELIMQQRNKHVNGNCTTCIRCHRPKMLL